MKDHILKAMQVDIDHDPQVDMMINNDNDPKIHVRMIIDHEMDMKKIVRAEEAVVIVQDDDTMIEDVKKKMIVDLDDDMMKQWIKKMVVDQALEFPIMKRKVIDEGKGMNMKTMIIKMWIDINDNDTMKTIMIEEANDIDIDPMNIVIEKEERMNIDTEDMVVIIVKRGAILLIVIADLQDDALIVAHIIVTVVPIKTDHITPYHSIKLNTIPILV